MAKKFKINRYLKYSLILLAGLLLGWLFFGQSSGSDPHAGHNHEQEEDVVWTCSMHPQIRSDKPGLCPLCAMDLTPLRSSGGGDAVHPDAIQISEEAIALANIQTTTVSRQNPVKDVHLYGTVQVDERLSQSQTSHVNGRIEKLLVNFTGETVKEGQPLALVYSPDLLNAQQELIEASKMEAVQPALLQAAKEKLRLWKVSDNQIEEFIKSGKTNPLVEIGANTNGVVINKNVNQGDYITQGSSLMDVANLSQVWVMFDAYESDLPFLKVGDKLEFTLQAVPGKKFNGQISFIDPLLNKDTRTTKVRVVTPNQGMQLKPEMYASATVSASLKQFDNEIVIPKSAVLWTGKRSIVYVKQPDTETPAFMLREVDLGPALGGAYVVLSGIEDGEEIATNGTFTIDATAQLEGKRSMMNLGEDENNFDETKTKGTYKMLKVGGSCEMCKDRIEKTAKGINGVHSAMWDIKTHELHLDFDDKKTSLDDISKAIAAVGHDTELHKAPDDVYEALPACCLYRE